MLSAGRPPQPLVPTARRWLARAAVAGACLALLAGCGRRGRDAAKAKITQAHHAFTADDFVKAAADGDGPLVEAFVQAGQDLNAADAHGATALMAAAAAGKTDLVKTLLDDNAKTDLQNPDGATALALAAANDHPEAVRALVEANADARVRDKRGLAPLLLAVNAGHERVVDVLLATSRDQLARDGQLDRALVAAAILGKAKVAALLLDRGANVNAAVEKKQTALMFAAAWGRQEIVDLLLARGADPKLVDTDGANASVLALQHGFPDVAKRLDTHAPGGLPPTAPATLTAAAASPSPAASPALASNPSSPPAPTPNPAEAREQAWLKEQGVQPATLLAKDTGQDDDKDGFTNDEELAAGTDPNDPASHPPYHTKLRLRRVEGDAFPIVFEESETKGGKVVLTLHEKNSAPRRVEVEAGGRVPGMPYRVERVHARSIAEKDTGRKLDVSELTLLNTETNRRTVLVKGMASNGADARATLRFLLDGTDRTVVQGEEFALPREPGARYQVLDIRPTQVVLKIVGTAQTVTVEK